jgi:hypothetical protein
LRQRFEAVDGSFNLAPHYYADASRVGHGRLVQLASLNISELGLHSPPSGGFVLQVRAEALYQGGELIGSGRETCRQPSQ